MYKIKKLSLRQNHTTFLKMNIYIFLIYIHLILSFNIYLNFIRFYFYILKENIKNKKEKLLYFIGL